jgi:hypothetical protein
MKVKCDTMLPTMMKTLMTVDFFEGNEPLFPPNVLRPEDITNQEVRGFDDGEVLQRVHNVDQMLRDVEFQRVYRPSELARLKQFIEDSNKPLYSDCHKYSHLSGDLKLLQLKADHGWSNKSLKHLLDVLRDMIFGTALTCHFGTSMQCAQQPRGSSLCGFHVAFHMLRLLDDIPDIKKAAISR